MQKTSVRPVMEATTNSKETSSTMCFLLAAERDGHNFRGLSSPNLNLMGENASPKPKINIFQQNI